MDDMDITSAQFWASTIDGSDTSIKATINGEVLFVPNNAPGNRHYDEIMRQQSEGLLTIQDAE
jgi:hypothetical protein